MEEFLTPEEVAKLLRRSEDSITRLLRQNKMPGYKVEGAWLINRRDLEEYLVKQKNIQDQDKK